VAGPPTDGIGGSRSSVCWVLNNRSKGPNFPSSMRAASDRCLSSIDRMISGIFSGVFLMLYGHGSIPTARKFHVSLCKPSSAQFSRDTASAQLRRD